MKRVCAIMGVCATALLSPLAADEWVEFSLEQMTAREMESFKEGKLQAILRIDEGEVLPFDVQVGGDVLALYEQAAPILLQAKRKVYIKIDGERFSFSEDKKVWKSFEEEFTGELGLSAGNSESGPSGSFHLNLSVR